MNNKKVKNILFDLDGTLIDSFPGIQRSFDSSFEEVYKYKCDHNISKFVGPPIKDIFVQVTQETNNDTITRFVSYFKEKYDTEFYKMSVLYNGISDLLDILKKNEINLYIATNKRLIPTNLIVEALNISQYFKKIYCLDSGFANYHDKSGMITQILDDEKLELSDTIYVGDTSHDLIAAQNNKLSFIYADYGFGNVLNLKNIIYKPLELINYI